MRVLVVNAGSSSLKLRLLAADDEVERTADVEPDPERLGEVLRQQEHRLERRVLDRGEVQLLLGTLDLGDLGLDDGHVGDQGELR